MFEKSMTIMKENSIQLKEGLSDEELKIIEDIYELKLPEQLKSFYSTAIPISQGFYNWGDFRSNYVDYLKQEINRPTYDLFRFIDDIDWCDEWGDEPVLEKERNSIIYEKLKKAPKLIPFFGHRYIPEGDYSNCPILSVYNTDIIYYGSSIDEYFEVEYGYKSQRNIDFDHIDRIPFWTDLI